MPPALSTAGLLNGDESATLALPAERRAYVHVVRGVVTLNGQAVLTGGDAAKLSPQTDGEQVTAVEAAAYV